MALWDNVAFRRLFLGRLVTNAGDSLYLIASMWLVFELTGSTFFTGVAGFLLMAPQAFQFLTGPFVDRWEARWILVGTQALQGTLVLLIPLAWWFDRLTVWLLLALVPLLSMLNQFVYPTLNAVLPRVVARERLSGANAAFAAAYQGVDMAFNAIGGLIIALVGAVALFLIDAVTFAVLPGFAAIRGGPAFYGLLLGAVGAGILLGSVLAPRLSDRPFGRLVVLSFPLGAGLWLGAVVVPSTVVTLALAAGSTVAVGLYNVGVATIRQAVVPDHLLGRVSSVSASVAGVATPVGALLGGLAGEVVGVVPTVMAVSFGILAMWALYVLLPGLRGLPSVDQVEPTDLGLAVDPDAAATPA